MPGITGIISKIEINKGKVDIHKMVKCMSHGDLYSTGTFANEQLGINIGWACHKNSFSDCNPIYNEEKDLILFFYGEVFAKNDTTDVLKKRGHKFEGNNASYLIHLYEEGGTDFLKHLNGWFIGVLLDLQRKKIIFFNDRYGYQRLYYHEGKESLLFSSEAKSLLKIQPELREIDQKSLGEYFMCNCVLENRTLFPGIFLLPGGSVWTVYDRNIVKKDYYFKSNTWEDQPTLEKEVFYSKLKEVFVEILPRYFQARQQIGMSLTGGLDSRIILACREALPGSLPCYTFGGMYRDSFDVKIGRKLAAVYNQDFSVLRLNNDFIIDFPNYAQRTVYISDGCQDVSRSHELYLNQLARNIAPIRMTGKYGGEVLRGVSAFKTNSFNEKPFYPDFEKYIQQAERTFLNVCKGHRLSILLFKEIPWHSCNAIQQSQLILRTPYLDNNLIALLYQAPVEVFDTTEMSLRIISDNNSLLSIIKTDRGIDGSSNYFVSMMARLYYETQFKFEYTYSLGMPNWLARIDSKLHLERFILGRHKIEHYRVWFRDQLSEYLKEILLDRRTLSRPYIKRMFMEKIINSHIRGNCNYTNEIIKVLTVELIHRLLIDDI